MKKINYLLIALVAMVGCVFTSCKDDNDTNLSRAVLASVDLLEFDALSADPQIITVTSDADWVSEAPEWVTISPATGHAGQTEVTISVDDNLRTGEVDNPRKTTIKFKGRNLWSEAPITIRQGGDKFRDPVDYTISAISGLEDETVVSLPDMIVTCVCPNSIVVSDGTEYMHVQNPSVLPEVGDKVTVVGEKHSDLNKMTYVLGERINKTGTAALPTKEPVDITETFDKTNGTTYQYVTFTGNYDGTAVNVENMNCKGYFVDPSNALNLKELGGHKVKVTGYYAGMAAPVINIIPASVEDLGVNEVIYFFDDFEWMDPWCEKADAHDYVKESDTLPAESKNIAGTNEEGKRLIDEFYDRGYNFVKATYAGKDDRPFETRIYMQRNYLKFSLTGIEAGIILPKIENIPAGEAVELCFDWSPMRQGNPGAEGRKYDAINIIVIVENNGVETQVPVPAHTLEAGGPHEWMHAVIDLSKFEINANTKITLRSADDKWPTDKVNRWFFDNVKIRQKK